jgi:two-component system, LytTR family, response regulator
MNLKALIVDDEKEAGQALSLMLQKTCPDLEITGIFYSAIDAAMALKKSKVDILFLDVEMPGGNGFDMLEIVDNKNLYVIFTTAHSEYAIRAIKKGAKDYLLKPIDPDELVMAVAKAQRHMKNFLINKVMARIQKTAPPYLSPHPKD